MKKRSGETQILRWL